MKGKIASGTASPAKAPKMAPVGFNKKGIHPMTKAKGSKKMSRVLKGVDKKKQAKGVVVNEKHNKLAGKYF